MERVFDNLIGLQQRHPRSNWRTAATGWSLRLAANMVTGIVIGAGIAVGRLLDNSLPDKALESDGLHNQLAVLRSNERHFSDN